MIALIQPYRLILVCALGILMMATQADAQSPGPLTGKVFGSGNAALVVVLHGDVSKSGGKSNSKPGAADYHYALAKRIAAQNKNVTVLAMLRPGYHDSEGRQSIGSTNGRRDHYTKQNNKLVAQTIQNMANATGAAKVVAVGHSGGAAQIGVIIGAYPNVIDSAILVSCPCDIKRWRTMRNRGAWKKSQSPKDFATKVPKSTTVYAVTGTNDSNTSPVLAQDYVARLSKRGVYAAFVPVKGANHGFNKMAGTVAKVVKLAL
ncbi:MAG: alpha/beta hydrolase family protein [Sulfitobacter sp.]